jgi:hypothetical protein
VESVTTSLAAGAAARLLLAGWLLSMLSAERGRRAQQPHILLTAAVEFTADRRRGQAAAALLSQDWTFFPRGGVQKYLLYSMHDARFA